MSCKCGFRSINISSTKTLLRVYTAANAKKIPMDYCVHLAESDCHPMFSYDVESFNLSNWSVIQLNVCWNSVHRKRFYFKPWYSVKKEIRIPRQGEFRIFVLPDENQLYSTNGSVQLLAPLCSQKSIYLTLWFLCVSSYDS